MHLLSWEMTVRRHRSSRRPPWTPCVASTPPCPQAWAIHPGGGNRHVGTVTSHYQGFQGVIVRTDTIETEGGLSWLEEAPRLLLLHWQRGGSTHRCYASIAGRRLECGARCLCAEGERYDPAASGRRARGLYHQLHRRRDGDAGQGQEKEVLGAFWRASNVAKIRGPKRPRRSLGLVAASSRCAVAPRP